MHQKATPHFPGAAFDLFSFISEKY